MWTSFDYFGLLGRVVGRLIMAVITGSEVIKGRLQDGGGLDIYRRGAAFIYYHHFESWEGIGSVSGSLDDWLAGPFEGSSAYLLGWRCSSLRSSQGASGSKTIKPG